MHPEWYTSYMSKIHPDWPPPISPLALALTKNSEVALREVSAYLNLPSNRGFVNRTICHRGYHYYFVDGSRRGMYTLPIFWAIDSHYFMQEWAIRRLAILFDHGAEVNVLHKGRQITPLYHVMINLKNLSIAKFLVENGADPNFEADICPILCDYINRWEGPKAIRFLLEVGTDPNQYDKQGWTPLIVAIHCGCDDVEETVDILLENRADPLLRSRTTEGYRNPYYGMSALEVSCCARGLSWSLSMSLLEKMLRYIPAHKYSTENLQRTLYIACTKGYLSSVELILDTIPPEEFKSHLLQGALYLACNHEELDVIMFLVKRIVE
jgi:ankyrin repeat protein